MVRENVQDMEKSSSSVPNHFQPYDTSNSRNIFSYLSSEDDNLRLKASESYIKVLQSSKRVKSSMKERNKELQLILKQIDNDKIKKTNLQTQLNSSASYESKLKGLGSQIKQKSKKQIHHLLSHPYLRTNATLSQSKPSSFQASKEPSILSEIGSSRSQSNQINQISPIYHLSVYQKIHQWQSNLLNHDINPNLPSPGRELKFKEYSIWH